MPTPDDFDPLAALESMLNKTEATPADGWGTALEIPLDLDVLAAPLPGEASADLVARAVAAARAAPGPIRPARIVRSESPDYAPAPPLPYPFDLTEPLNEVAIARLALPATNAAAALERQAAALRLVREYEARHSKPLGLALALSLFWRSVVRIVDVPAVLQRPGVPRNALRLQLLRPVADDFAAALRIPPDARPRAFEAAGIPMPKDKNGKPKPGGGVAR